MNRTTNQTDTTVPNTAPLTLAEMQNLKPTPAMEQYIEIKRQNPDYLLFYRMGDFYELFFEDAITASNALALTLTSRSKHEGRNIPMCGVPYHAYETYLARLIKMGYKVAVCEQAEDPKEAKKRGYKEIVRREVARLVTAGTVTEDELLNAKRNNYIAAACIKGTEMGLAWLDISTGAFFMQSLPLEKLSPAAVLSGALARLCPAEFLFEDKFLGNSDFYELFKEYKDGLSPLPAARFNYESALQTLHKAYKVKTLAAYGDFTKNELTAAGVLFDYVENTQKGKLPQMQPPKRVFAGDIMEIDQATRKSLELLSPQTAGGVSLLDIMDKTVTGIGGRLLAERLSAPIRDIKQINDRLDAVTFLIDNPEVRREIRRILRMCQDMQRAVQRLSLERGGPRDLWDLAETLSLVPALQNVILSFAHYQKDSIYSAPPFELGRIAREFFDHSSLAAEIKNMLLDDRCALPLLARNGDFIKKGALPPLDFLKNIRKESAAKCEQLRLRYTEETGISSLKVKDNSIIGFYVEVPSKAAEPLLDNPRFIHRQSVLNAIRFTTEELTKLQEEVFSADERALEMECEKFDQLVTRVLSQAEEITKTAESIARIDVAAAMAELAAEYGYVRPQVDDSCDFFVTEGRHPVVETALKKEGSASFVGNNCGLEEKADRLWLLTGPNMAGKSTFLRQNALIAIMAQMGSFVPAKSAKIGIIDKLFSRVGASDDLARGRSTFMVEMVETAAILNRAGPRSFVILDEIGRGTATFDGLSIAWAVVEHLAEINKCRTIFATHYHEMTKLANTIPVLSLHCMKIKEFNNEVIFMHEVIPGAADRSYGIHVARLAGLPELALTRSEQILKLLEEQKQSKALNTVEAELPLFENLKKEVEKSEPSPLAKMLQDLDIDALTPREALNQLYSLKEEAKKKLS